MTVRIFVEVGFSDFIAYRYSSICCFKSYSVYVCIKVVAFGSCKLLDIVSCACCTAYGEIIASIHSCGCFGNLCIYKCAVSVRLIRLCCSLASAVGIDTECSSGYLFAGLCVNLVDNDIRIRLVLEVNSCYSIGLDLKVFTVLGNISYCLSGLDLCYLVIADKDIAYRDCTLCVGCKGLVITLTCLCRACYSELPATENAVRTVLYNTYRTGHSLVRKYFLYNAVWSNFKSNGIYREAVACCTAYFVHCVFFSCGKLVCNKVICGFVKF